jgi:hypothetical protein
MKLLYLSLLMEQLASDIVLNLVETASGLPSGLLAKLQYSSFIPDIQYYILIFRYKLRYRSSATISCISRYRVIHDIGNTDIGIHAIVYFTML